MPLSLALEIRTVQLRAKFPVTIGSVQAVDAID